MDQLEFFFDCSSPWTYLGFESLQALHERHPGLDVVYKPILVGGVFNAVNQEVYETRAKPVPQKARHYQKDLQDWAAFVGITIGMPPVFPVNSVKVMRGAFVALEQDCLVPYARAVFEAYWRDLKDISQPKIIAEILQQLGLPEEDFFAKIQSQAYKDQLKANTTELIERGGYGSPTLFLNGEDMYFGNDRLPLIEAKLTS